MNKKRFFIFLSFFVLLGVVVFPFVSVFGETGTVHDFIVADTWINSEASHRDWCYEGNTTAFTGYSSGMFIALLDVNISEAYEQYLSGNVPDLIYLRFYGNHFGVGTHQFAWEIREITEAWDSDTVTYDTKPTYSSIVDTGAVNVSDVAGYFYLNITDTWLDVISDNGAGFYGYQVYWTYDLSFVSWATIEAGVSSGIKVYYADEEPDTSSQTWGTIDSGEMINYWILFVLLFTPALLLAGIAGMAGFASGLCLGSVIGISAGIVPSYATLIIGIILVVFVVRGGGK